MSITIICSRILSVPFFCVPGRRAQTPKPPRHLEICPCDSAHVSLHKCHLALVSTPARSRLGRHISTLCVAWPTCPCNYKYLGSTCLTFHRWVAGWADCPLYLPVCEMTLRAHCRTRCLPRRIAIHVMLRLLSKSPAQICVSMRLQICSFLLTVLGMSTRIVGGQTTNGPTG